MIELIRWYDYLLFLAFLLITIVISNKYIQKRISSEYYKYFLYGLILKLVASQIYVHVYVYYYGFGDTIRFYRFGQMYKNLLFEINNLDFFEWLFMSNDLFRQLISYRIDYSYGFAESSLIINKISGIMSFFTFNSFLLNTALFSFISYIGLWYMYKAFVKMYPKLKRELALSILFVPSVVFWGSGLMKDTICIGAVGFMTYNFCRVFIIEEKLTFFEIILNILMFLLCSYIISIIKIYQLIAYLPGTFLWLFYHYRSNIKNNFIRISITPFLLAIVSVGIVYGLQAFSEELDTYALDNVVDTAIALSYNLGKMDAGSAYDLGPISPSIGGLLSKMPIAVNVTLFRPYVFEVNNIVMFISSLESSAILILSVYIFLKVGFFKFFKKIFESGILLYCFIFTLIFGFAVGMSSSNFGNLVRYKIPLMPFYVSGLFILYYHVTNQPFFDRFFKPKNKKTITKPNKNIQSLNK